MTSAPTHSPLSKMINPFHAAENAFVFLLYVTALQSDKFEYLCETICGCGEQSMPKVHTMHRCALDANAAAPFVESLRSAAVCVLVRAAKCGPRYAATSFNCGKDSDHLKLDHWVTF